MFAKDGETYEIDGKSFLAIGGAYSVDKYFRLARGWKWFEDEQISKPMRTRILNKIKGKHFDYVLTHTCPYEWRPTELFINGIDEDTVDTSMEKWLSEVEQNINYGHWFFGHYHGHKKINDKADMLFREVIIA